MQGTLAGRTTMKLKTQVRAALVFIGHVDHGK
jgi:hypothetical protein